MTRAVPGHFITFEGGEGAGKTTLVYRLAARLHETKHSVVTTRAPGGTNIGVQIRDLLLPVTTPFLDPRAELFLFLADRAQHVAEVIRPALQGGNIVLCDRFNDSTIAYQSCGRGFAESQVRELCTFACQGLQPDMTFYLDLLPEEGLRRSGGVLKADRIEAEGIEFHQKIRVAYLRIAQQEPERIRVIDATNPLDVVEQQVMAALFCLLQEKSRV